VGDSTQKWGPRAARTAGRPVMHRANAAQGCLSAESDKRGTAALKRRADRLCPCERGGGTATPIRDAPVHGVWASAPRCRRPMSAWGRCGGGRTVTQTRDACADGVCVSAPRRRRPVCAWGRCWGWGRGPRRPVMRAPSSCGRRRRGAGAGCALRVAVGGVGARPHRPAVRARSACGPRGRGAGARCVRGFAVGGVGARATPTRDARAHGVWASGPRRRGPVCAWVRSGRGRGAGHADPRCTRARRVGVGAAAPGPGVCVGSLWEGWGRGPRRPAMRARSACVRLRCGSDARLVGAVAADVRLSDPRVWRAPPYGVQGRLAQAAADCHLERLALARDPSPRS